MEQTKTVLDSIGKILQDKEIFALRNRISDGSLPIKGKLGPELIGVD